MNILIIGSSGFLGTELIKKIPDKHNLVCFDIKNISKHLIGKKNIIRIIKGDISSSDKMNNALKNIDLVFYKAGILGGPNSLDIKSAEKYLTVNCEYLYNFLKIAKSKAVKKIIFDSSEQVFGDYSLVNKHQNYSEPLPMNFYGLSKLMSEKILLDWSIKNKTAVDIFRYPRVMNKSNDSVINKMIKSCVNDKKIIINGDLNQKITFLHINDVINANLKSLQKIKTKSRILNLSNNNFISLKELALKINKKLGSKANIINKLNTSKNFQPVNSRMTSTETQKILKWKPRHTIDDIIDEKILFFKKNF